MKTTRKNLPLLQLVSNKKIDTMSSMKLHLIGFGVLVLLFIGTIFLRSDEFNRDMGGRHEWITAHSLTTMEIWDKNGGPSAFGFNPVYSYPEAIQLKRQAMGGVKGENGLHYYTSYPPFAFIFGYYATQLMGGPSVDSIRVLNYLIHFACGFILFLILYELMPDKKRFNLAGVIAATLYFYSTGFLWGHGFLYFSDMLEQLLIILCIYVLIRFWKGKFKKNIYGYGLLFLVFFLATYTEWLGLFFSFFTGLAFLLFFFIKKNKSFLFGFFTVGLAASLALGTTVLQYSSIGGWDQLVEVSTKKYNIRSGRVVDDPNHKLHIDNEETHDLMRRAFDMNYKNIQNIIGAVGIAFVPFLFIGKLRRRMTDIQLPILVISLLLLSLICHYYIFFNFNALHSFSGLKTGMFITLIISILVLYIYQSMPNVKAMAICAVLISGFVVFKMYGELDRYKSAAAKGYHDLATPARTIGELNDPNKGVFANVPFHAVNLYYSKRDWFWIRDTATVSTFMTFFKLEEADYFHIEGGKVTEKLEYRSENKQAILLNKEVISH